MNAARDIDGRRESAELPGSRAARSDARPIVLLVEDDPHDREIYGKTLWYNGFEVLEGEDGEEALSLAREYQPDLVILDLLLPKLNGLEVCRRLKADAATAGLPVLALTARSEREFGLLARHAGCLNYIEKPVSPFQVLQEVEAIVGRAPPAA